MVGSQKTMLTFKIDIKGIFRGVEPRASFPHHM